MNRRSRFLLSLNYEEPDRVPLFYTNAMPGFIHRWMERYEDEVGDDDFAMFCGSDLTIAKMMGFDAVWCSIPERIISEPEPQRHSRRLPALSPSQFISRDGRIHEQSLLSGARHTWYVGPALKDLDLWFEWWDDYKTAPLSAGKVSRIKAEYEMVVDGPAGGILPVPVLGAIFEVVVESLGLKTFSYCVRKRYTDLKRAFDRVLENRIAHVKTMIAIGVDVVLIGDDSAYKNHTYISPSLHEDLVVPCYKRIARLLHEHGIKFLLHSDGYTAPYFPGFISAGIDGIETIEEVAGMDLKALKACYGDRLALMGPMDCSRLLSYGSPSEVEAAVEALIEIGAPGGGFAMGPCTSLLDTVPLENVEAMITATCKYGRYPLKG